MALPITTLMASVLSLWLVVLSLRVIDVRRTEKISLGDGDSEAMRRRIRAQANLAEYAPFAILLCGLAEFQGLNSILLATLASLFVLARLAHGYALSFKQKFQPGRFWGMVVTFVVLTALSISNVFLALGGSQ